VIAYNYCQHDSDSDAVEALCWLFLDRGVEAVIGLTMPTKGKLLFTDVSIVNSITWSAHSKLKGSQQQRQGRALGGRYRTVFAFDPFVVSFVLLSLAFVVFHRGYTCLRMIYKQRNLFSIVLASILSNVLGKLC